MSLVYYVTKGFGNEVSLAKRLEHAKKDLLRTEYALDKAVNQTKHYKTRCLDRARDYYMSKNIKSSLGLCSHAANCDSKIERYKEHLSHQKRIFANFEKICEYKTNKGKYPDYLEGLVCLSASFSHAVNKEVDPWSNLDEILEDALCEPPKRDLLSDTKRQKDAINKAAYCYFALIAISAEDYKKNEKPSHKLIRELQYDALPELKMLG